MPHSAEEMTDIFLMQCEKNCYTPDEEAVEAIREYLRMASEEAGEFGNARGVRNVFEKVLSAQANRLAAAKEITREELLRCTSSRDERSLKIKNAFIETQRESLVETAKIMCYTIFAELKSERISF